METRRFALAGAAALAVPVLLAGAAFAARSYPDRVGDVAGGSGPDIASLRVANTARAITFRLRFAKAPPLRVGTRGRWVDMLLVAVDVPPLGPRPVAPGGEWRGADFALGTHGPSKTGVVVRLGEKGGRVASFEIRTVGTTMTFSVPRRALGGPAWFAFSVAAARETEQASTHGGVDVLPDRGTLRYALTG
jgi:hypothetical protein